MDETAKKVMLHALDVLLMMAVAAFAIWVKMKLPAIYRVLGDETVPLRRFGLDGARFLVTAGGALVLTMRAELQGLNGNRKAKWSLSATLRRIEASWWRGFGLMAAVEGLF